MTTSSRRPSAFSPRLAAAIIASDRLRDRSRFAWTARESKDIQVFAPRYLWIQDKERRECRLALNAAQLDYSPRRTRRDLILKARQLGFSTFIQADIMRMNVRSAIAAMTLSHDDDSTQRLRRMADLFYGKLPDPKPKRKYANASITTYPETGSEAAIGTAGSKNIGRSFTLTHLHGSEVAFWPDAEKIVAGAMQAGNPSVVLESTPNGAQGYFYELCMEAQDGKSDWVLHFYPWWWDQEYRLPLDFKEELILTDEEAHLATLHQLDLEQIKWRRAKQRDLKHLFLQEYPEDPVNCFLLSGTGYFGPLVDVFTAPHGATPQEDHIYYAGLDFGQSVDFTVLSIGDWTTKQQVFLLRLNQLPWGEMRRQIVAACEYWNVKLLVAEWNAQQANVEELGKLFPRLLLFQTSADSKQRALAVAHEAFNEHGWKLLDLPEQKREMRAFQARQSPTTGHWSYSAPTGEHDDIVMANTLMIHGATMPPLIKGFNLNA